MYATSKPIVQKRFHENVRGLAVTNRTQLFPIPRQLNSVNEIYYK